MAIEYRCNNCLPAMKTLVKTPELDEDTFEKILSPATLALNKHLAATGHTSYDVRAARSIIQITVVHQSVRLWAMGLLGSNTISKN